MLPEAPRAYVEKLQPVADEMEIQGSGGRMTVSERFAKIQGARARQSARKTLRVLGRPRVANR